MKAIFALLFLALSFAVQGALVLNVGENYTYQFTNLTAYNNCFCPGLPGGQLDLLGAGNLGLEPGDTLLVEMFEGAPTGSPILSRTLTSNSPPGDFSAIVDGAWQDFTGSFRLTVVSGSVSIQSLYLHCIKPAAPDGVIHRVAIIYPSIRPNLELVPSPQALTLRWPTSSGDGGNFDYGFVLESSLPGTTNWQAVTNAVQTNNGKYSVTVDYQAPGRFFRLRTTHAHSWEL